MVLYYHKVSITKVKDTFLVKASSWETCVVVVFFVFFGGGYVINI